MPKTKTPTPSKAGYAASRYNAAKHGGFSDAPLLPWENSDEYEAVHDQYTAEYSPEGPSEIRLVRKLADVEWHDRRLRMAEAGAGRQALLRCAVEHSEPTLDGSRLPFSDEGLGGEGLGGEDLDDKATDEELLRLVEMRPEEAIIALGEVEAQLSRVKAAIRNLAETGDLDQGISALPGGIWRSYKDKLLEHSLGKDGSGRDGYDVDVDKNDPVALKAHIPALSFILKRRQIRLTKHQRVLAGYREIHEAAQYEMLSWKGYDNIARAETRQDRKFKDTLSLLLQLQKFRKQAVAVDPD